MADKSSWQKNLHGRKMPFMLRRSRSHERDRLEARTSSIQRFLRATLSMSSSGAGAKPRRPEDPWLDLMRTDEWIPGSTRLRRSARG
jgi:hypothetical protein